MPNVNNGGTPLLPPSKLWGPNKGASQPVRPANPQTSPSQPAQTLPSIPAQTVPSLPPIGQAMPLISFSGTGTAAPVGATTPQPGLGGKLTQLRDMIKNADDRLMDVYNVKLLKDPSGKISGYLLNGRQASAQEVQQHLLPRSGVLHQQITDLKAEIDQTYRNFTAQVNQQFPALAASEQTSVRIQLQAVQVVYENFVARLGQVDSLIK